MLCYVIQILRNGLTQRRTIRIQIGMMKYDCANLHKCLCTNIYIYNTHTHIYVCALNIDKILFLLIIKLFFFSL